MGIDYTVSNALLHALSYVKRGRAVTLGRQEIHAPDGMAHFLTKYGTRLNSILDFVKCFSRIWVLKRWIP